MRQLALTRAAVLTPFELIEEATVLIRQGRILSVGAGQVGIPEGFQEISLEGLILAPGLIDLHLHGNDGTSVMTGNVASLVEMTRFYATHGVTSFLATTAGGTEAELASVAAAYAKLVHSDYKGSRCLGLHLEAPGGSTADYGVGQSNNWNWLSVAEVERLQQLSNFGIKKITLAPEMPGALEFAAKMTQRGITCSIGRSQADFATVVTAIANGFSSVTHCCDQLHLDFQEPGAVGAALLHGGLTVELNADGQQLHPATLELVWRLKGTDGIILASAAMAHAGSAAGRWAAGDGDFLLGQGHLSNTAAKTGGSIITLEQAVRNFWQSTGCELTEAFQMATNNPAKLLGMSESKGSLAPGKDADIIAITPDFDVVMTMVAGEIISGLIAV